MSDWTEAPLYEMEPIPVCVNMGHCLYVFRVHFGGGGSFSFLFFVCFVLFLLVFCFSC